MATPQWYQTPNLVTAAIKLKGIPPDKIGDITAKFGEQYCAMYMGGESPDEPMLTPHFLHSLCFCICYFNCVEDIRDMAIVDMLNYCIMICL